MFNVMVQEPNKAPYKFDDYDNKTAAAGRSREVYNDCPEWSVWVEDEQGKIIPVEYHPTYIERDAIKAITELCIGSICSVKDRMKETIKKAEIDQVLEQFDSLSRQRIIELADIDHYHRTKPHDYCD